MPVHKIDLNDLQKKYPEFVYDSFGWSVKNGDLSANFLFLTGDRSFSPGIVVRGINKKEIKKIGEEAISNFVFHLGLAEMPSYWKSVCASKIIINAGYLDKAQIRFWQNLFERGMGQFFFENKLPFIVPEFQINFKRPQKYPCPLVQKFSSRVLVPMGGGKDSLVSWEFLRKANKKTMMLALNPNEALDRVCGAAGGDCAVVFRRIDPRLIAMNKEGFLNGHTPFSSLLSFYSVTAAALFDCGRIAISQERSSDEGNVEYLKEEINHQYSKSFDFEKKFRAYSKKYLVKNIDYFSILRPLYELQIMALFSRHPQYFSRFLSCNKPFTLAARAAKKSGWCGKCPKCLAGFAMLYPFAGAKETIRIFGKNLFADKYLLPLMTQLLGEGEAKPFECVGTFEETRAAFYLSLAAAKKESPDNLPVLMRVFEREFLPKYGDMKSKSGKILSSWNKNHHLPEKLEAMLRACLADFCRYFPTGVDNSV